mmetsp:Transcript_22768/g.63296  ORF Transcript_22768/g.63296 Transcript_22768/m.63296 type:complete len:81 (-) Transcript_22768:696-938(-)
MMAAMELIFLWNRQNETPVRFPLESDQRKTESVSSKAKNPQPNTKKPGHGLVEQLTFRNIETHDRDEIDRCEQKSTARRK